MGAGHRARAGRHPVSKKMLFAANGLVLGLVFLSLHFKPVIAQGVVVVPFKVGRCVFRSSHNERFHRCTGNHASKHALVVSSSLCSLIVLSSFSFFSFVLCMQAWCLVDGRRIACAPQWFSI